MPGIAVALFVVYLLLAFVVRGVLQWKRTGDSGMRLDAERPFSTQWWARLTFVVGLLAGFAAPIAELADRVEPIAALDRPVVTWAGLVLAVVGIASVFVAQLRMGASWRVGVDPAETTELVVRWPFSVVRNPIFTAMGVTSVGLALLAPSPLAIGALVLLGWGVRYQVVEVEEPYLARTHGAAYDDYRARVGRFLPGIGTRRA